jgi:hypothetical protein
MVAGVAWAGGRSSIAIVLSWWMVPRCSAASMRSRSWSASLVGQGSLQLAQDDPHQDVLVAWADTEPGDGLEWELVVGRLGQHADLLDGIGVVAHGIPDAIAETGR